MSGKEAPRAIVARGKPLFFTPAGTLGFSSLMTPDEYEQNGVVKSAYKARIHLAPSAVDRLAELIQLHCMSDVLIEEATAQCAAAKKKWPGFRYDTPAAWLKEKLKEPKEDARIQLPSLVCSRPSAYKNKAGDIIQTRVKVWDPKNTLLDLKTLRLGMGSTVQLAVYPNLFISGLSKNKAEPTLRLEGIRVLKLEQYGAGGPQLQDLNEEDLEGLEEGFEVDNLSSYAVTPSKPTETHTHEEHPDEDHATNEPTLEDEIPF